MAHESSWCSERRQLRRARLLAPAAAHDTADPAMWIRGGDTAIFLRYGRRLAARARPLLAAAAPDTRGCSAGRGCSRGRHLRGIRAMRSQMPRLVKSLPRGNPGDYRQRLGQLPAVDCVPANSLAVESLQRGTDTLKGRVHGWPKSTNRPIGSRAGISSRGLADQRYAEPMASMICCILPADDSLEEDVEMVCVAAWSFKFDSADTDCSLSKRSFRAQRQRRDLPSAMPGS